MVVRGERIDGAPRARAAPATRGRPIAVAVAVAVAAGCAHGRDERGKDSIIEMSDRSSSYQTVGGIDGRKRHCPVTDSGAAPRRASARVPAAASAPPVASSSLLPVALVRCPFCGEFEADPAAADFAAADINGKSTSRDIATRRNLYNSPDAHMDNNLSACCTKGQVVELTGPQVRE